MESLLLLSLLAGWLYRLGGKASPYLNTKIRDVGVALVLWLALPHANIYATILSILAVFGVLTVGYGEDSPIFKKFGAHTFLVVGFLLGLALLPWATSRHALLPFIIRTAILTAVIHFAHVYRFLLANFFPGDASDFEEFARGFAIVFSTGIFLI